jgi:speckle-type POZ protein
MDAVCESWSRTEQCKVRGRHQWTIDDFVRRAAGTEVGDSLCSPVFEVTVESDQGEQQSLTFQLEVFPNGEEGEDNSDYVAVFLTSRRQEELEVKYDFSVLKADGTCYGRIGNTFKKFSPEQNSWGYGKAFSKAKLQEKASDMLPEGCLTIVCNLEIYYCDRHLEGKKRRVEFKPEETPSLGDQLIKALKSPSAADVTLICKEKRFPCHKVILRARSDVFDAMFSHEEMAEMKSSEVMIEDTDPDSLEQLLQFIYSDKVEGLAANAAGLLTLADKYNIPRLKGMCEESMCKNIEVGNAADLLVLAYLHETSNLRAIAVDFITCNMSRVSETPGWKGIAESHPRIMNEIVQALTAKMK